MWSATQQEQILGLTIPPSLPLRADQVIEEALPEDRTLPSTESDRLWPRQRTSGGGGAGPGTDDVEPTNHVRRQGRARRDWPCIAPRDAVQRAASVQFTTRRRTPTTQRPAIACLVRPAQGTELSEKAIFFAGSPSGIPSDAYVSPQL